MIEAIVQGLTNVFSPGVFPWIFLGVIVGLIVGILPGLGGGTMLAICLPLIFGKDPAVALALLVGMMATFGTGGPITSILFGIPGEAGSVATILDGYPMAQKGMAGRALGAAIMASVLGGFFGAFWLVVLIPVVRPIILAFGSPEILMMAILAISFVAVLGRGSMPKALVAAALGMMLGYVGRHPGTGVLRYTSGILYLHGGFAIIPVVMGIFAIPEVIELMVAGTSIAKVEHRLIKRIEVKEGIKDCFRHWWLLLRCSAIGTAIGIIPGIGSVVAQWLSYGHAKQTSRRASEFGQGCVEGVIAAECPDNAKEGGALLTTLAFGVPGSVGMAIFMGALMILGIPPGPEMITKHLDLVWTVIFTLIIGNALGGIIALFFARDLARVTFLREVVLSPLILLLVVLGAYGAANSMLDVLICFGIGILSYLLKAFDYSRVTLVLGFILGDYIERYFLISLSTLGPGFLFDSPIAIVLALITILGLSYRKIKGLYKKFLLRPQR